VNSFIVHRSSFIVRRSLLPFAFCLLPFAFCLHAASTGVAGNHFQVLSQTARELTVQVTMADDSEEACSRFIAVPPGTTPGITVLSAKSADSTLIAPPSDLVTLGKPVHFRDLNLVPLIVHRSSLTTPQASACACVNLKVEIPAGQIAPRKVTAGFAQLYRSLALNSVDFDPTAPEGYLMIVPDGFYSNAQALARWKEQKGFTVTVAKLSQTGSTANEILAYIANAYHTWNVPPEYVLLCGTYDQIPTFTIPQAGVVTDHTYGCIDGNDFFPEVLVGRLPVNSGPMFDYLTEKILHYERAPYMTDTLWFHRATMVSTIYDQSSTPAVTALECKRWVRNLLLGKGFNEVDTVFDPPYHGSGVAPVDSSVNRGVSFINGRGWGNSAGWDFPPFSISDVDNLSNGWELPVITSLYCGTGAFNADPCFGEAWLQAGSPTQPKGGVAFFGPSWLATSTRWNNDLDFGIYRGIFDEGISTFGPAEMRGKLELFDNFPMPCDSYMLRVYFYTYNVIGDPSLALWTGAAPKGMNASYAAPLPVGATSLPVTVRDANMAPVEGALVALLQDSAMQATGYTGAGGQALLAFSPLTSETLFITITKPGYLPYTDSVVPFSSGEFVGYDSYSPTAWRPGENISLTIGLKNFGSSQSAPSVSARLRCSDTLVTISDSVASYGDIAPGATATGSGFSVLVSAAGTSGHTIGFTVAATSGESTWTSGFAVPLTAAKFAYLQHTGNPPPGQDSAVVVTIYNDGVRPLSNVTGILTSISNGMTVEDSVGTFGNIAVGETASNSGDVFRVRTKPDLAAGRTMGFNLTLHGDSGFDQVLKFGISAGEAGPTAPFGPDAYGYYAYDDVDTAYTEHPSYTWIEIDPNHGGSGTRLGLANNQTLVIYLPFAFRYYGQSYNRISVCSNGFLTCDSTLENSFYNWRIPSAYGPPNLIAPFWDDFRPDTLGASGVYNYYDQANNRFVVEWSRVEHILGFNPPIPAEKQTFEVLLDNPADYPTRTGDGPIVFQYDTVYNTDTISGNCANGASVGIANRAQDVGLQCLYAESLSPAVAPIGPGRAIKFTTNPPDTFYAIRESDGATAQLNPVLLRVSSNPLAGPLILTYRLPANSRGLIRLFDIGGRRLQSWKVTGSGEDCRLPVPALHSGVYFVNLTAGAAPNEIRSQVKLTVLGPAGAGAGTTGRSRN
jgi:hypothetical protein